MTWFKSAEDVSSSLRVDSDWLMIRLVLQLEGRRGNASGRPAVFTLVVQKQPVWFVDEGDVFGGGGGGIPR